MRRARARVAASAEGRFSRTDLLSSARTLPREDVRMGEEGES